MTLEELLNKLIEKGWKPFGRSTSLSRISHTQFRQVGVIFEWWWEQESFRWCTLRELTSKESWLWQFVCENALYSYTNCVWKGCEWPVVADYIEPQSYQYRLIESALKDESELESFILDNIEIDG